MARGLMVVGAALLALAVYTYFKSESVPAEGTLVVAEPQVDLRVEAPGVPSIGAVRLRNNGRHPVRVIGLRLPSISG